MTALLSGWWSEILTGLAVVVALVASYFGGKKIGTTQTQAKADVTAAKVESAQVSAVAEKQKENAQVAKDAQTNNAALSDAASRNKLHSSRYNTDD
ncbi:hypothetical protein JK232_02255 [Nissabacter archeti]|uniref:DUF2681 domain-containing protein n=1 Tax=Nissabacter archeti TaxID=1917880 RepID=A0ABS5JCM3_9GAMM|nr:hypothetical protein [Nissabacter archeti]MBS0967706.1 hypothetical protein [Nissabacter archeti]